MRDHLLTAVLTFGAVPAVAFVVAFWILEPWRATRFGRHIMAYSAVVAAILTLAVWARLGGPLPRWIAPVMYLLLSLVIWQRLSLLVRTHWRARRSPDYGTTVPPSQTTPGHWRPQP